MLLMNKNLLMSRWKQALKQICIMSALHVLFALGLTSERESLIKREREALQDMEKKFGSHDIMKWINEHEM